MPQLHCFLPHCACLSALESDQGHSLSCRAVESCCYGEASVFTQTCLDPLLSARASPRPPLHGQTPHASGADSPCVQVRRCLSIKGAEDLLNKPHAFEISTTDDSMFFIADTDKVRPRMAAGPGPRPPCFLA